MASSKETNREILSMKRRYIKKLNEHIKELLQSDMVYEMAIPRKKFKEKIENLMIQILENWCLVHYCTIVGRTETKNYWKNNELRPHLIQCAYYKMQGNNSYEARLKVLQEVWSETECDSDLSAIDNAVCTKFAIEGIDTKNNDSYKKCIQDCLNAAPDIMHVIALGKADKIQEYINTL